MSDHPAGMATNGLGKTIDWLNHTRSLADNPGIPQAQLEINRKVARRAAVDEAAKRAARRFRYAGYDPREVGYRDTWRPE